MSDVAICVESVSKQFRIGARQPYHRVSEVLQEMAHRAVSLPGRLLSRPEDKGAPASPGPNGKTDEFWALRDISFEVKRGESLGIIGRNGAGKSTLLKILSRITEPTLGRFGIRGRVGSLLEVGTGFHPELTGRENVFLNGSILGMTHREIQRHFDEIVDFAEVERFLDTPVKHYSSGMAVRLGFAVAAHMLPDVLIVDEVLAVGDAAFQKKCLGKMDDATTSGRTVLFVSHNMAAVQRLCSKALFLEGGKVFEYGETDQVLEHYLARGAKEAPAWQREEPYPDHPHFRSAFLCYPSGRPCPNPTSADQFGVHIEYCLPEAINGAILGLAVCAADGTPLFATRPHDAGQAPPAEPGLYRTMVQFPKEFFMPGRFSLSLGLARPNGQPYDRHEQILTFDVAEVESLANSQGHRRQGALQVYCHWNAHERVS